MCARHLAAFCLFVVSLPAAKAAHPGEETAILSLRLRTGELPLLTSGAMQKEVAELMGGLGFEVRWEQAASYRDVPGRILMVDLDGDCRVASHAEAQPVPDGTPIGSTASSDNRLLPFITLNCDAINGLMTPSLAEMPQAAREFLVGRAMGRILAHEIFHIVTQSPQHAESGVAKARFSAADLLKPNFEFDENALARLHAPPVDDGPDPVSGDSLSAEFSSVTGK